MAAYLLISSLPDVMLYPKHEERLWERIRLQAGSFGLL